LTDRKIPATCGEQKERTRALRSVTVGQATELTAVEYGYVMREGHDCILLEKKEDLKRRGLASPDEADGLALTFAHPVAKADQSWKYGRSDAKHEVDYDPMPQGRS
jgi:hypothetical protein